MTDDRRSMALAIKSCLDNLQTEAERLELEDLARFIGLASLAAEEAALSHDSKGRELKALMAARAGHC